MGLVCVTCGDSWFPGHFCTWPLSNSVTGDGIRSEEAISIRGGNDDQEPPQGRTAATGSADIESADHRRPPQPPTDRSRVGMPAILDVTNGDERALHGSALLAEHNPGCWGTNTVYGFPLMEKLLIPVTLELKFIGAIEFEIGLEEKP